MDDHESAAELARLKVLDAEAANRRQRQQAAQRQRNSEMQARIARTKKKVDDHESAACLVRLAALSAARRVER